ncbi:nucleotide-binding universal stress UspA family protein [Mariniflexile fucanivorans]|uniref:Nucleotide-binding universal stress UspA family protein n=1 Tax=Mariniflexile fucanivorans TaxID=264023 RepID=A0A4R1RI32_9FLAO|nr:universal stress protein [Mariniflexile fucanivorans]TCL65596.1 nucleotide-binding universal stress UspA family protein [Mariniflexile fucanivorans]
MQRKILLPTDFSDNSWSATVYALKLFKDEFCTFYFLNSAAIKASIMSNKKLIESMKEDTMTELMSLKDLAETSNANANHDFQIIFSTKDLINAIKTAIEEFNIDLVIMGTKGTTPTKEFLFGSNTINIITNLKLCPILVIPEEYDFVKPSQIAFPTDFNRFYSEKELKPLKELADLYNSKIRIVHIITKGELNETQEYNLMILKSHLKNYEFELHWMPNYAKKVTEINDFIQELEINMLAMVNYKHSFIEKIMHEPVIKKIGFHPDIPFLVIPD